jgi:glutathione synthase
MDAAIVIVVQQGERNSADQELLIKRVTEMGGLAVRMTLKQIGDMSVDDSNTAKVALPDGTVKAVSVFYHRALYDLRDFPDEEAWATRERLEKTNAIKCPSLPYHMCGCKRVQQAFTRREVLNKFLTDDEATLLLQCMVPQFLLHDDSEVTRAAVADAIANPSKYVIKTQEEATGRLFSGQTVIDMLSIPASDPRYTRIRHDHLLMERIVGLKLRGGIVRDGVMAQEELESEFGTFGTIFSDGETILSNVAAGYVVRTKAAASEGGGVMSGVSVLDTVAVRR